MNNSKSKDEREDEEDDDIIINDDFDTERVVVKSMTVELFKTKSLIQQKEEEEEDKNKQEHNEVDTKDHDSELPFDTQLVYQDKGNVLNKLTIDQVQCDDCNEKSANQRKETKAKEVLDENMSSGVHSTITSLLLELEAKNKMINQLEEKSLFLNNKLESNNEEMVQLNNDIVIKKKTIEELICKNKKLEEDLVQREKNWKNYLSNPKTILSCNKSLIKIEKQLAASFDQINRLSNENYVLKQTINKFYKTAGSKISLNLANQVSLSSTLTTNPTNEKNISGLTIKSNNTIPKGDCKKTAAATKNNHSMNLNHSKSSTITPCKPRVVNQLKKNKLLHLHNTSFDASYNRTNYYNVDTAIKESKILEIETTLYKLQNERDKLNEKISLLPEFPKQKTQTTKKKSLESAITEYNNQISLNKQKLVSLNKK